MDRIPLLTVALAVSHRLASRSGTSIYPFGKYFHRSSSGIPSRFTTYPFLTTSFRLRFLSSLLFFFSFCFFSSLSISISVFFFTAFFSSGTCVPDQTLLFSLSRFSRLSILVTSLLPAISINSKVTPPSTHNFTYQIHLQFLYILKDNKSPPPTTCSYLYVTVHLSHHPFFRF